jgi:hypothetical protein
MIQTATNPHYNYLVSHGLYFDIELIGPAITNTIGTYQTAKMHLVIAGDKGEDRKTLMLEAPIAKEWTDLDIAMRMLLMINQKYHSDTILDDFWSIRKYKTYRNPANQE